VARGALKLQAKAGFGDALMGLLCDRKGDCQYKSRKLAAYQSVFTSHIDHKSAREAAISYTPATKTCRWGAWKRKSHSAALIL
jgi:hypothetical protein